MANTPFISICIPAYGMGGQGAAFLQHSFDIMAEQDFTDFEVVVADQSDDTAVADLCAATRQLNVHHVWTRDVARQNSANANAAMDAAQGEVIKLLFQDDFLHGPNALSAVANAFADLGVGWVLTGCAHSADGVAITRPFQPRLHPRIHWGRNTVSSPSVLAVRRAKAPRFDEALTWLMDVDFYRRCQMMLGEPVILPDPLVVNRIHPGQVSSQIKGALKRREFRHIRKKYRAEMGWGDYWHYLGQMRKTWL